jgi:cell division septation protein DedD
MVGTVIKSIVLQGKRVIIPDFGAFLIKDSSLSNILSKDNVTFSPFLKYNDGFLDSEIAHRYGIHTDEARAKVALFVEEVKYRLYIENGAFEIEGLGFFFKDRQGNTTFSYSNPLKDIVPTVAGDARLDIADEAIPEVEEQADQEEEQQGIGIDLAHVEEEPSVAEPPVAQESTAARIEEVPITTTAKVDADTLKEFRQEEKLEKAVTIGSKNNIPPSRKRSKLLLYSFILLVGLLAAINIFWNELVGSSDKSSRPMIVLDPIDQETKVAEQDKVETKEAVQDAIDNEVVSTVERSVNEAASSSAAKEKNDENNVKASGELTKEKQKNSSKEAEKAKEKSKEKASSGAEKTYVVVLGSFATSENAQKHVEYLSKKGIKAMVLHRGERYSVVSKTYKTYDDADAEKNRVKALGVDGWISSK